MRRALAVGLAAVLGATSCVVNPQRELSARLLSDLVVARSALAEQPPQLDPACGAVFNARTRLLGEPGLTSDQHLWSALDDSARSLAAVCGQATLLEVAVGDSESFAVFQARQRWQQGLDHELEVACMHLRDAAADLQQPEPC